MKNVKMIISCMLMLVIICLTPVFVFADSKKIDTLSSETSKNPGSISIVYKNPENSSLTTNMKIAVSKIADYTNGEYFLLPQYEESGINLNKKYTADEIEDHVKQLVNLSNPEVIYKTDLDGRIKIDNVSNGVYLVYEVENNTNIHMSPCLVSVPMYSEDSGNMLYDIEMIPKYSTTNIEPEHTPIFQTGINNYTTQYVGLAILMLTITASILFVSGNKKVL